MPPFPVILLGAVVISALILILKGGAILPAKWERRDLLTPAEAHFARTLRLVARNRGLEIAVKIRVADLVTCRRDKALRRQFGRHIDFVLHRDFTPVACIELNDSSHDRRDRSERDADLAKVFSSAGLPLIWIPAARAYLASEVEGRIFAAQAEK